MALWKDLTDFLASLGGAPGYVLTLLISVVGCYIVRALRHVPNEAMPTIVTLWGALWNLLLADPWSPPASIRLWVAKNIGIGLIIGFVGWLLHKKVMKRLNVTNGDSDPRAFVKEPPAAKPVQIDP